MIESIKKDELEKVQDFVDRWGYYSRRKLRESEVESAISKIYEAMGMKKPIIQILNSPRNIENIKTGEKSVSDHINKLIKNSFYNLKTRYETNISETTRTEIEKILLTPIAKKYNSLKEVNPPINTLDCEAIHPYDRAAWGGVFMFCKNVLNIHFPETEMYIFLSSIQYLGWFYPYQNICLVCKKPKEIKWKKNLIHNDSRAAIIYEDNYEIWANEGIKLNKSRYHRHPKHWEINWLLEEQDPKIKYLFFKIYGHEHIYNKLNNSEIEKIMNLTPIDTWGKYSLFNHQGIRLLIWSDESKKHRLRRVHNNINEVKIALLWGGFGQELPTDFFKWTINQAIKEENPEVQEHVYSILGYQNCWKYLERKGITQVKIIKYLNMTSKEKIGEWEISETPTHKFLIERNIRNVEIHRIPKKIETIDSAKEWCLRGNLEDSSTTYLYI